NKRCDQVIRTMLSDAFLGFDEWEALCKDRNSYSLKVAADPDATITSLHCRELSKISKMLLQSVGSERKARSGRINKEWRKGDGHRTPAWKGIDSRSSCSGRMGNSNSKISRVVCVSLKISPSSVSSLMRSVSKMPRAAYGGASGCEAIGVMVTGRAKA